jgi:hypothetical protein
MGKTYKRLRKLIINNTELSFKIPIFKGHLTLSCFKYLFKLLQEWWGNGVRENKQGSEFNYDIFDIL